MLVELSLEGRDDVGVELRAGTPLELVNGVVVRQLAPVDALTRHRVIRVGDEEDAGAERNLLGAELVRVAAPVPAFVVVQDPRSDGLDAERVEHAVANLRVALEDEALGLVERTR